MDEGETKTCGNCKREIPVVNFTTHAVHCARNIRVCPACKEPVPAADLPDHHDKMHKLLPCRQCGESVCGTDLEDHVRDSCAHTMKSCRFCALELRRGELPPHERYCGARTERCDECGEWVMHKYRQLHLDSNHGFIRLDEDPVPTENAIKATNMPKPLNVPKPSYKPDLNPPQNSSRTLNASNGYINSYYKPQNAPSTSRSQANAAASILDTYKPSNLTSNSGNTLQSLANGPITNLANSRITNLSGVETDELLSGRSVDVNVGPAPSSSSDGSRGGGAVPRAKRSNHQPQLNSCAAPPDKVNKDLWASRGAVKKRPAPQPPGLAPPPDPRRDRALSGALQRQQLEERQRRDQTQRNLANGLPPVLSAAAKLDKLRKMDALHARQDEPDVSRVLRGRVWADPAPAPAPGHVLGRAAPEEVERRRRELRDAQPMSHAEFMRRFDELRARDEPAPPAAPAAPAPPAARHDRFSQIKSSLRELRRGLNEVTAPYNISSGATGDVNHNGAGEERLPCEFCGELVSPDDLVQHQTGCRPDLTQYRPQARPRSRSASREPSRDASREPSRDASPSPVIPCEFCTAPLPVYLISEHQERCGREANLLFSA